VPSQETNADGTAGTRLTVPADLSPADAAAVHDAAMAALQSGGPIDVDLEGDGSSLCALQLLIATKRSAETCEIDLRLSDRAASALSEIEMS